MEVIKLIYDRQISNTNLKFSSEEIKILQKELTENASTKINNINVNICNNDYKVKLFVLYCIYFGSIDGKKIVGLDFEFNTFKNIDNNGKLATLRENALTQILMSAKNGEQIFIIEPKNFVEANKKIFISCILTSKITRIVHGADSLDVPFVISDLLNNDKDLIVKFIKKIIDTRYLCEYQKILQDIGDIKCSIYDAMLYFGIIDDKLFKYLNKTNDDMGPIYDVNWDINNMSNTHVIYAAYDVIYLKKFLEEIIKRCQAIIQKDNIKVIPDLTKLVYYSKNEITEVVKSSKKRTDEMNNYFFYQNKKQKTLSSKFNEHVRESVIDKGNKITDIFKINFLKMALLYLLKDIYYDKITDSYNVYIKNDVKYEKTKIKSITNILKELNILHLKYLAKFLEKYNENLAHREIDLT